MSKYPPQIFRPPLQRIHAVWFTCDTGENLIYYILDSRERTKPIGLVRIGQKFRAKIYCPKCFVRSLLDSEFSFRHFWPVPRKPYRVYYPRSPTAAEAAAPSAPSII